MSDKFSLQPNCSLCSTDLDPENENNFPFMMAVGDSIDLACPKCGVVWRFWLEIVTRQKKIGQKKLKKSKK